MTYFIVKRIRHWPFNIIPRIPGLIGWAPVFNDYQLALNMAGSGAAIITVEDAEIPEEVTA